MAVIGNNILTLLDWAKRIDPDGAIPEIVELLAQTNEILLDMLWMEGNLPTGHRTTVRTGLPSVFFRLLNQGVQPSKSTTAQIDEAIGILEAWSEVDLEIAALNGNTAAFRLSEAQAFIEAMNIQMSSTIFYGNSAVNPEQFTGLSPRYSAISGAANGSNIVSGGGAASVNSSVWLVAWGAQTCHGIFPKGSQAGVAHKDHGEQTVETQAQIGGTRMRAFQDQWIWKAGIALKDWRYVVRGANIDTTNLVAQTAAADLVKQMIKMTHRIPFAKLGKPVLYMNRTVFEFLDIQRRDDVQAGGQLNFEVVDGQRTPFFRGIPIRICDALLQTEATVS